MPAVRMMKPRPAGGIEFAHDLAQFATGVVVVDLAADADALQSGHQHEIASGDADVGRERRALGADALLDDLHQHFAAALEDLLDGRLVAGAAIVEVLLAFARDPLGPAVIQLLPLGLAQQMLVSTGIRRR